MAGVRGQRALPYRILIADGGADGTIAQTVAEKKSQGLDVEYVRYPFDSSYADYYAKLADALSRVTTPFVVMADNDDLFIPEGLTRAVEFLLAHPGYVACGGQCAVFWLVECGRVDAASDALFGDRVEWKCSSQFSTDVADTAASGCASAALAPTMCSTPCTAPSCCGATSRPCATVNPRDLFLMEQLVMFLTAIAGKTRQLDTLYIARQQDSPGSSGGAHQERFGDWYDRMLLPTWSEDFTRFVDCATAALSRADGIPADEARRIVVESYKMSVAPSLLADLVEEPTVSWSMPTGAAGGPRPGQPAAHERASPGGAGVLSAHPMALARFRPWHRISDPAGPRGRAGIHAGAIVPDRAGRHNS